MKSCLYVIGVLKLSGGKATSNIIITLKLKLRSLFNNLRLRYEDITIKYFRQLTTMEHLTFEYACSKHLELSHNKYCNRR